MRPEPEMNDRLCRIGRRGPADAFGVLVLVLVLAAAASARGDEIIGARYAEPVARYGHFALGRPHEYGRIVATTDAGRDAVLDLPDDEVFEDLAPRRVRLQAGEAPTLLAIVSSRAGGARLALIGLDGPKLAIVAQSAPIGTPNRWLNPIGVADLDGDGVDEIAAVTTPHIGGVLRVYRRRGDRLHVYGSTELGLSTTARIAGRMQLLVPDAQRATLRAVALDRGVLVETAHCALPAPIVDPRPLIDCAAHLGGAPIRR
jgi:hypothetical protein